MDPLNPHRIGGPCERARVAATALARADVQCRHALETDKDAANVAYRAAFEVYREAQEACLKERLRSRR